MNLRLLVLLSCCAVCATAAAQTRLAETEPLKLQGDIASQLVEGIDRFLLRQLDASVAARSQFWQLDASSREAYEKSVAGNRERLRHILGLRDPRRPFDSPQLDATLEQPAEVAATDRYRVVQVRWPVVGDIVAEGLLLEPLDGKAVANVVAWGDADQTPEMLVGLAEGAPAAGQFARRLAESGCRVLIPELIDRTLEKRNGRANLTSREFIYRSAFELGRHLIGYEVAAAQAGVDWFLSGWPDTPVGAMGWGEGGMLAFYAAAVDARIDAVCVSGFFGPRERMWEEPLDRNVFGLLERFGGAELTLLVAPRPLILEACRWPSVTLPSEGGAPAELTTPTAGSVGWEHQRALELQKPLDSSWPRPQLVVSGEYRGPPGSAAALEALLQALDPAAQLSPAAKPPRPRGTWQPPRRQARLIHAMDRHNQYLLRESAFVREQFMSKLDTSSVGSYLETVEPYRETFRDEIIGRFDLPLLPPNVRTRLAYDEEKWRGYDVVMDVFPDVIAYGVLLVPKDIPPGQRRPVVVCQHGLEGRPRDTIEGDHRAYHDFAAKLAERGFVTFAPQNLYIFRDRFRTLQRKANPLKKTLFSVIVPQHQQITDWLKRQPFVDPQRIGFYGLSYGGKSAMRIPPLVSNYCLSICSADFNEWVWKNASTRAKHSYVWTGEYEIFEFDLGSTFNYAEMAALIAPRPFMVERGHFDGVAPDEKVAHEFAKVRRLYSAGLKLPERVEIEWFVGPHTINAEGTFRFLHKHLKWPAPQ